ncbi:MAG: hypothetical protein ACREMA_00655, partial [Longimicrobiales bacterium]
RVLSRHGTRTTRTARALATCIGLVALTVAWVAPHPPVPARAPATPPVPAPAEKPQELTAPATSTAPASNTNQPDAPRASVLPQTKIEDGPVSRVVPFTPPLLAVIDRPLQPIATVLPCARAGGPEVAPIVDDIFNRLFDGITLSREREARACEILIALHTKQAQHDETVNLTLVSSQAKRVLRDAALRELLTNDVDRATFDAHAAQAGRAGGRGGRGGGGGGRARSGGAAADTVAGGRAGRGGGIDTFNVTMITGGGGRGGARRGGGAGQEITLDSARLLLDMSNVVNNLTFRQLFEGIQLTPQQEARARELITNNQQEVRAQRVRPAGILRLNPATGVVSMEADGGAQLLALVSSEADRAKLESRITSVPR